MKFTWLPSRALLAARSATLGLGLVISRHVLSDNNGWFSCKSSSKEEAVDVLSLTATHQYLGALRSADTTSGSEKNYPQEP